MGQAAKFEVELIKKQKESKDAFTFYFKRPKEFNFSVGQYIKIFLNISNPDNRGSSRYFTISSSPFQKEYITITTRIIKSSFKLKLNNLNPSEKLNIFGPIGYFDFYPEQQNNVVFIAGGIGVTPFHSILKSLEFKKISSRIFLFNSFDIKDNVVFYDAFKIIEKNNPNVKVIQTLTKDKNYPEFEKGRINNEMLKKYIGNLSEFYFFITGSEQMVNDMYVLLKNMGVSEKKIFKEDFPGY